LLFKVNAFIYTAPGIEAALRDALTAEAAAQAEAKRWRTEAEEWRRRYEQQVQQVQLLRSQSTVSAEGTSEARSGGTCAYADSGTLLEPCEEPASAEDAEALPTVSFACDVGVP
jgi:hypothetical protein